MTKFRFNPLLPHGLDMDSGESSSELADALGKYYGVEYDTSVSSPDCTRVGDTSLHVALPIQNAMRACLLNDDGSVNYYLDPTDWTKKLTGGDAATDGTDGQVMIEIPAHYFKYEVEGTKRRILISPFALTGFTRVQKVYVSAYEANLDRTNLKLGSFYNEDTQYRGGDNNASYDAVLASRLGKPVTSISRTNMRTYARNRGDGWEMYNFLVHNIIWYLFTIEYNTLNSQKAVNSALDGSGYRQGGLGDGVTDWVSADWNTFNGYNPFVKCGESDSLASGSGEVAFELTDGVTSYLTTQVNRYRGIEMPFGHIWKNADGVNVRIGADSDADPTSRVYISDDPHDWQDSVYTGMTEKAQFPRVNGYVTETAPGTILPITTGGGSSTYFCDYFYTLLPVSGVSLRTLLLGGNASKSGDAGLGSTYSASGTSDAYANFGTRLCYFPEVSWA